MFSIWLKVSIQNYKFYASRAETRIGAIKAFWQTEVMLFVRCFRVGFRRHYQFLRIECNSLETGLYFSGPSNKDLPPWFIHSNDFKDDLSVLSKHHLVDDVYLDEVKEKNNCTKISDFHYDKLGRLMREKIKVSQVRPNEVESNAKSAVYVHMYYPELWSMISSHLEEFKENIDVHITVPEFTCCMELTKVFESWPNLYIYQTKNIGRDIYPFLTLFNSGVFDRYESVCKLHTKKSLHIKSGNVWMNNILDSLLGSSDNIKNIVDMFSHNQRLGVVGPSGYNVKETSIEKEHLNKRFIRAALTQLQIPEAKFSGSYFSGTMFWFRPKALDGLKNIDIDNIEFPYEMKQTDGTIMHAFERLFNTVAEFSDYEISTEKSC